MNYYKLTFPNGYDFQTGNTINYRDKIGKTVQPKKKSKKFEICSNTVLHASENLFDAMSYARLPCAIFVVEGEPVIQQSDKCGFAKLKVVKEIPTTHWHAAYCDFMIWMLQDNKNFVGKKQTQVLAAIDGVIQVFIAAKNNGFFDESAAESAVGLLGLLLGLLLSLLLGLLLGLLLSLLGLLGLLGLLLVCCLVCSSIEAAKQVCRILGDAAMSQEEQILEFRKIFRKKNQSLDDFFWLVEKLSLSHSQLFW